MKKPRKKPSKKFLSLFGRKAKKVFGTAPTLRAKGAPKLTNPLKLKRR